MITNFKHINIGSLLQLRLEELDISIARAALFLEIDEDEVINTFGCETIPTDMLLKWSKLLQYDFFRIYTQHLILYAPQDPKAAKRKKEDSQKSSLPVFKKNIYTNEVINYLIQLVESGKKSYKEIQDEYNIPATTILRWANKYGNKKLD